MESPDWRAYHLFYHGDRDLLLRRLARPLVGSLLAEGRIDRFFFIRYALGGPHVRLRLRVRPGGAAAVAAAVEAAAADFFTRCPSERSLPEEQIRRANGPILTTDREGDDAVYPDNWAGEFPVRFEIERYGGPDLFADSLDLFAVSSVEALRLAEEGAGQARARQLPAVCRLLTRQACGFAAGEADLLALLEYAVPTWGSFLAPIVAEGDRLFERRPEIFRGIVRQELERLGEPAPGSAPLLAEAARRLAARTGGDGAVRRRIGVSQMHMTANRLGLLNPDEVYLSRALARAAQDLAAAEPAFWRRASELLAERSRAASGQSLGEIVEAALATLLPAPRAEKPLAKPAVRPRSARAARRG